MEAKLKYLSMIQSVIQRIANNSFFLKGWTVTLVIALITLLNEKMSQRNFLLTYVPVVAFWFLDSYYLQLERKYRVLYNVARLDQKKIDFDLDICCINYKNNKNEGLKFIRCFFTTTELMFYGPIVILLAIMSKIIFK